MANAEYAVDPEPEESESDAEFAAAEAEADAASDVSSGDEGLLSPQELTSVRLSIEGEVAAKARLVAVGVGRPARVALEEAATPKEVAQAEVEESASGNEPAPAVAAEVAPPTEKAPAAEVAAVGGPRQHVANLDFSEAFGAGTASARRPAGRPSRPASSTSASRTAGPRVPPIGLHQRQRPAPATAVAAAASVTGRNLKLSKPAVPRQSKLPAAPPVGSQGGGSTDVIGAFYDDTWREKREAAYTKWINFALSEPFLAADGEAPVASSGGARQRQRLSLRELEVGLAEAGLRRKATLMLRELRAPLAKIEQQVQEGIICVRPTLNLAADVGLRDALLSLLCSYNPIWLRLAVEAVTGEEAPGRPTDLTAVRRFLDKRVLVAQAVVS